MGAIFQELFTVGIYKRSQGRITRQVTFAALALAIALGFFRMYQTLDSSIGNVYFGLSYWLPGLLGLMGVWVSYRAVNLPGFADFLIAVEAEMNKVSWPTRGELFRASMVVLICIIILALILFGYDIFWRIIFQYVLHIL
jgi:preprotein translocase subunit SecE